MANKKSLADLRNGTPPHKRVHIGGDDGIDVMVVLLGADVCLELEEKTNEYCLSKESRANEVIKNQFYNALLCKECMRDADDISKPVSTDIEEILRCMDLQDISLVVDAYNELMMNKAPKLELLTEEQLDELKKTLEVTPLSGLSTVSLVHLANFHQSIVSEQ